MRSAALEDTPHKIRLNTINPSIVDNRMMRSLVEVKNVNYVTPIINCVTISSQIDRPLFSYSNVKIAKRRLHENHCSQG